MSIKAIVSDFSYVLLFPNEQSYRGSVNALSASLAESAEEYDPLNYFAFNEELFELYRQLSRSYPFYLYTEGIMHSWPSIKANLDQVFTYCYSAEEVGFSKRHPHAFPAVAQLIGVKPTELLFIDDKDANLETARQAGVTTIKYVDNQQMAVDLRPYLK